MLPAICIPQITENKILLDKILQVLLESLTLRSAKNIPKYNIYIIILKNTSPEEKQGQNLSRNLA